MTPLCKVDVTLPGVRGAWGVRGAGGVDEQEEIRPARGPAGRSVWPSACRGRLRVTRSEAASGLSVTGRCEHGGAASLLSKRRGRPSNNRLPEAYRELALLLVRKRYADFGPPLAAEKLAEVHGCT